MVCAILMSDLTVVQRYKFRPAEQGSLSCLAIVLGLIVYILIGATHDYLFGSCTSTEEGLSMKTKAKKVLVAALISVLMSVWTVGANLLAGALLA